MAGRARRFVQPREWLRGLRFENLGAAFCLGRRRRPVRRRIWVTAVPRYDDAGLRFPERRAPRSLGARRIRLALLKGTFHRRLRRLLSESCRKRLSAFTAGAGALCTLSPSLCFGARVSNLGVHSSGSDCRFRHRLARPTRCGPSRAPDARRRYVSKIGGASARGAEAQVIAPLSSGAGTGLMRRYWGWPLAGLRAGLGVRFFVFGATDSLTTRWPLTANSDHPPGRTRHGVERDAPRDHAADRKPDSRPARLSAGRNAGPGSDDS